MMFAKISGLRRVPPLRLFLPAIALLTAVGFVTTAWADITDVWVGYHTYGGVTCEYAGISHLDAEGGSSGDSTTVINQIDNCRNGYRELYAQAKTTTNQVLYHYSDWVLYDYFWPFGYRTDLCKVLGRHRMSKAGVDTSEYIYTLAVGCYEG